MNGAAPGWIVGETGAGEASDAPVTPKPEKSHTPPIALLYTIQAVAFLIVMTGRHYGIVAAEPPWAYAAAIIGSSLISRRLDRWSDAPRGSWRLHVRVCLHAVTVLSVIYLTGWGPALGLCFVYAALIDLHQSGPASWRAVLGWSLICCAIGQLLVLAGWMPSFLSRGDAQSLGFLGAIAFSIVIIMAGALGEAKKEADDLLALTRDTALRGAAHHRAVVENAAEGILTVALDGIVQSFNRAAQSIFGWAEDEIVGKPIYLLVQEDLHDALRQFLAVSDASDRESVQRNDVEVRGVRRDGSLFPMSVSTSAILGDAGTVSISGIIRDLSDQKRLEDQLTFQVMHDPLTGLGNRTLLTDRLDHALARARRHSHMCCVFYVDLDRFKAVNDTLGHSIGDQLLIEAASRITAAVRETDTVARFGGDEFIVLSEDIVSIHQATEIADRILSAFRRPFHLGVDEIVTVGVSIGLAMSFGGEESVDTLLANADIAMYRAKSDGRGSCQLFDQTMQQWVMDQAALEAALRQAVDRSELVLHVQPIVDAESGFVQGFEALVRWARPGFGLVGPDTFIPTAEETNLILEIGSWILDESCRHAASWVQSWPHRRLPVAVNISGRQLIADGFVDLVASTLARWQLDPTLLTLEITESVLIKDSAAIEPALRTLRQIGVNLALDDFGTGYSSLSYLSAFPINIVKIGQSFIQTIESRREDAAIVAAIIGLAQNLGLDVVAEGVESEVQLGILRNLNCRHLQGYLFASPQPIQQVGRILKMPVLGLAAID